MRWAATESTSDAFGTAMTTSDQSGREDLNLRPHGPEPCALAKLSYAPCSPLRAIGFCIVVGQCYLSTAMEGGLCRRFGTQKPLFPARNLASPNFGRYSERSLRPTFL